MGKPLIHMIPSQEAKLRGSLSSSDTDAVLKSAQAAGTHAAIEWKGKKPPATSRLTKGNSVRRSTTNASNESSKTSKSNDSNDCSFVHSNASLSSSEEQNIAALPQNRILVPDSITTSANGARTNKVRLAIQNFEQNIEITRQASGSTSSSKKRLAALKKIKEAKTNTQKNGDESTISSMSSYRSASLGINNRSRSAEDHGVIPRFEVLLDEAPEKGGKPTVTASKSRRKDAKVPSKLTRVPPNANGKEEQFGFSSTRKSPDVPAVNSRVIVNRQRSRSNKTRQRQLSNDAASSSQFFSAMDQHLAKKNRPRRIKKVVHSIEVVKTSKVEKDKVVVCEDAITTVSETSSSRKQARTLNKVLSPSKTKGAREIPSIDAASFKVQPLRKSFPTKKKKMYSINGGELVVDEVVSYEAIELNETGSVISSKSKKRKGDTKNVRKTTEETVKKPYRLVRLDDSKTVSLLQQNRSKASTTSRIAKGFRRISKRSKNASSSTLSRNPIKVVSEDAKTGAIELLRTRTPTRFGSSNTFSYDENEEDSILKRASPIPSMENLCIVGENNDIEVVASASKLGKSSFDETTPPADDESMNRIVSIRKLSSQDENSPSPPISDPIKTISPVRSPSPKELSTPPKKFEPVVETPSNRVEGTVDVERADSYSAESAASVHSKSSMKSSTDSSSRYSTPPPPPPIETGDEVPRNGDQLVFVGNEQNHPQIKKGVFVPKIPASKRDTKSKKGKILKTSSYKIDQKSSSFSKESPRKVKIQVQSVQKPDVNVQNIEISSVATPTSTDSDDNDLVPLKKYGAMVVKKPSFTVEAEEEMSSDTSDGLFDSKCIVSVNVLGVAGIVVDRKKCRDFTGDNISPCPPEHVTAVVGICDQDSIEEVTTFSSTLVHAPNSKDAPSEPQNDVQRHIAVWSSNHAGESPGSIVKSKMLNLKSSDKQFLELKVALAKSSDRAHHAAVIIGTARIEITEDMIGESNNRVIDMPVSQVTAEGPLSPTDDNHVLLLRTSSEPRNDFQKLAVDEFSSFGIEDEESLASAYAIDPSGDSMIRLQLEVNEVKPTTRVEKIEITKDEGIEKSGSFTNKTATTERSEESSIKSRESEKETEDPEVYSKPVEAASECDEYIAFQPVSRKDKFFAGYQASDKVEGLGCKIFGRKIGFPSCAPRSNEGLASRIDDRIEGMAERIFSTNCSAPKVDDSSVVGDATYYTGATGTTQRDMLEEIPAVSPVPTMTELRELAKEFALTSGEFFFKKKSEVIHESVLSEDEDDDEQTGVESATLASSAKKTINSQSDVDDDEDSYTSGGSDNESEDSLSLNHQDPVNFNFNDKRRVVSESNKFDLSNPSDDVRFSLGRSFDDFAREVPKLEMEDEDSISKNKQALVDDIVDEEYKDFNIRRENSGKPSLPSVVENIAEVLSIGGKACGYFAPEDVDPKGTTSLVWNRQSGEVEIPKTVDQSDLQSVGELTAMTLEKNEIKEKNRKLLLKKLGLPKEILAWSTGDKSKDGEESQSESNRKPFANPENYFAEYEDGAEGVRSIYGSKSDISKQEEAQEEPLERKSSNAQSENNLKPKIGDKSEVQSV